MGELLKMSSSQIAVRLGRNKRSRAVPSQRQGKLRGIDQLYVHRLSTSLFTPTVITFLIIV